MNVGITQFVHQRALCHFPVAKMCFKYYKYSDQLIGSELDRVWMNVREMLCFVHLGKKKTKPISNLLDSSITYNQYRHWS